jgi:hypothetical protein
MSTDSKDKNNQKSKKNENYQGKIMVGNSKKDIVRDVQGQSQGLDFEDTEDFFDNAGWNDVEYNYPISYQAEQVNPAGQDDQDDLSQYFVPLNEQPDDIWSPDLEMSEDLLKTEPVLSSINQDFRRHRNNKPGIKLLSTTTEMSSMSAESQTVEPTAAAAESQTERISEIEANNSTETTVEIDYSVSWTSTLWVILVHYCQFLSILSIPVNSCPMSV